MGDLTCGEAGRHIGRSAEMVRRWIVRGLLPGVRHGRDWMVREEDLAGFVPPGPGRPRNIVPAESDNTLAEIAQPTRTESGNTLARTGRLDHEPDWWVR